MSKVNDEWVSILEYWRDLAECECGTTLPSGGCLRCDLNKVLLLGVERRSEPEVAHSLPPVATPQIQPNQNNTKAGNA